MAASHLLWGITAFGLLAFIANRVVAWLERREAAAREARTKRSAGFKTKGKDAVYSSTQQVVSEQSATQSEIRRRKRMETLEDQAQRYQMGLTGGNKLGQDEGAPPSRSSSASGGATVRETIAEGRLIRQLTDQAYKRSLEKDQAREARETVHKREAEAAEAAAATEQALKDAETIEIKSRLGTEPAADLNGVCTVMVMFPDGTKQQRRFRHSATVGQLMDFARLNDFAVPDEYELVSLYPRKALEDPDQPFKVAGLRGRCTVHCAAK